ncbi:MAG TPA: DUF1553 domain-containing protein [Fimbriiglobus sp.]|nr:DUF1553 domain-containing protein [Fimbriiglobus sp.]
MVTHSRLLLIALAGLVAGPAAAADPKLKYNRDVRPILSENCFACHGPDSAARKAKLRLDVRDVAVEAEAIVPGKPDDSGAIQRIFADDESERMPPAKSHKTLTAAQKDILKRWVAEGAVYERHWSLIPPTRPAVPTVKDKTWVRNPIDAFVLAELEKRGLKPAPEADRRTLARRLSLDLIGLPPKPEDVEAFVNDKSPDYYEKFVDQLMASPHWGEHRGRYWLDAARYADTHGIHFDNYREIWAYRDWVINAFNQNMPFDRFTVEQLAGDLLPHPTLDQRVATGFNRCNITTNEGGIIDEEYVVLYARDRTETVGQVWMGLTVGCAVCHDHKFDPLPQRDFYALSAFFNNTTQGARDGNIPNTPPVVPVPRPEDRARWEVVAKQVAAAEAKLDARKAAAKGDFDRWLASAKAADVAGRVPVDKLVFHAPLTEGKGKTVKATVAGEEKTFTLETGFDWTIRRGERKGFTVRPGESIAAPAVGDFEKDQPFTVSAWVSISKRGTTGGLVARMDEANKYRGWDLWMQADRVGMHVIHAWDQDALKVVMKAPLQPKKWYHVTATYDGSGKASGVRLFLDGEPAAVDIERDTLKSTIRTNVPLKVGQRDKGQRVQGVALQDVRVYSRGLTGTEAQQLAKAQRAAELLAEPADKRSAAEAEELFDWWLVTLDESYRRLATSLADLQKEETAIRSRGTVAHVMAEKPGAPEAYVLNRGQYDQRRDKVGAATPSALPPMGDLPHNRLGLAKWLLRADHPLTARVTVNRFWQQVFGTGIVRTPGDFGVTGEPPSHPDLLDWLAVEFREGNWDIKRFFKLIVTSNTYRQSAATTSAKLEKDADNRLLSRGPRFRMDAEMVRDYALAASGLLVQKIGGPSVKPYQPSGVWEAVAMPESNTRNYKQDHGDKLYRRSLYTFWKRAAPPASMEVFNAPTRETCTVRRDRTNTPLQALVTLNGDQFIEAARHLAQLAMTADQSFDGRLDLMTKRLLARPLRPEETAVVKGVHDELLAHYKAKPDEAKKLIAVGESKADPKLDTSELAAWTMVANQLMNLDEVLNK